MSSVPPPPQDDSFVTPQVVEKPGMSSGAKVLLILGIIFGVCALICCGGGIFFAYWAQSYAKDAMSTDPVVIAQRQAEVLDLEIPESFKPQGSFDMKIPFTGDRMMMIIIYTGQSPEDTIAMVAMGDMAKGMSDEQMRQQMEQQLKQQGVGQQNAGAQWELKEKEITVAGKPTQFSYRTAKNEDDEPERFQVTGMVQGKSGPVMITISVDARQMSEEDIDKMIESIK